MRVPDGYRVNDRYARDMACPACGAMLIKIGRAHV